MTMNIYCTPPSLMESQETVDYRQTVIRKRMQRYSPCGHLLSVTDVRTTRFEPPFGGELNPVPITQRQRSFEIPNEVPVNNDYRIPRPAIERIHPIKRVDTIPESEMSSTYPQSAWKTSDSFVRKSSILKTSSSRDGSEWSRTSGNGSPRVEWREPLDCLIDRMNRIRSQVSCQPLQPSVRLADISAQWARMLALRGEFRADRDRSMNIWMGTRPNESIADIWWDEAEEFGTKNFLGDDGMSWVGVASAYSDSHHQYIVVAVYE